MALIFVFLSISTYGQVKLKDLKYGLSRIEINSYFNHDKYPEFRHYVSPVSDDVINMKGNSLGIDIGYKFLAKKILLKPFLGYYRFSFNSIDNYVEAFNVHAKGRETILTPPYIDFPIATQKYFYDCFNVGISGERKIVDKKYLIISAGGAINNYITISQKYFHTYDNAAFPTANPHVSERVDYFGFRADMFAKLLFSVGKVHVGPVFSLPVFSLWRTDAIFPGETNNNTRNKWLNGYGLGITANYLIK